MNMNESPRIEWTESGEVCSARWHSEAGAPPPRRVQVVDDTLTADNAWRLACEGTALLRRGEFQMACSVGLYQTPWKQLCLESA